MEIKLESELVCPSCGHKSLEAMPKDYCQYFYECKECGVLLKPKANDCCVFCSYGSVPCPPIQKQRNASNILPTRATKHLHH
ncbi:GDCCVxC domain-containing (seleno)protein [Vibrio penaeicida]|uniref:GDCCVxC domain-containing (seleno)protein n=1 Tax=Vibrio penaeicida TaxID=104609 RepID=UPI000CE9D51B|nr:GDCCVxC domain-containing (seleno)protein [Vibrio penaeicida]